MKRAAISGGGKFLFGSLSTDDNNKKEINRTPWSRARASGGVSWELVPGDVLKAVMVFLTLDGLMDFRRCGQYWRQLVDQFTQSKLFRPVFDLHVDDSTSIDCVSQLLLPVAKMIKTLHIHGPANPKHMAANSRHLIDEVSVSDSGFSEMVGWIVHPLMKKFFVPFFRDQVERIEVHGCPHGFPFWLWAPFSKIRDLGDIASRSEMSDLFQESPLVQSSLKAFHFHPPHSSILATRPVDSDDTDWAKNAQLDILVGTRVQELTLCTSMLIRKCHAVELFHMPRTLRTVKIWGSIRDSELSSTTNNWVTDWPAKSEEGKRHPLPPLTIDLSSVHIITSGIAWPEEDRLNSFITIRPLPNIIFPADKSHLDENNSK